MVSDILILFITAVLVFVPVAGAAPWEAHHGPVPNPPTRRFCSQEALSRVVCDLILFLHREKVQVRSLAKTKTAAQFGYENVLDDRWVLTDKGVFEAVVYRKNQETDRVIRSLREDKSFNEKVDWKVSPVTSSSDLYLNAWKDTKPLFDYLNAFRLR